MPTYITSNQELGSIADAIRSKGGTSAALSFPTGFVNAIDAIKTAPTLQSKSASPTESAQTIKPDSGYDGLSQVTVGAISTTYIGSGVARKSSSDLTVSGGTVNVPAGYYAEAASKSVGSGTITNNTSGGTSSGTVNRGSQIKIGAGYYSSDTYYTAQSNSGTKTISGSGTTSVDGYANASVAAGSATTPATTISVSPSISVDSAGKITASNSGSKSVTPTVSAGWVASGTAGTITVSGSNTKQLTTKAAATYYTSTSDQTISGSQYLTGAQTIKAVTTSNISAGNIRAGVTITVGDANSGGRVANVAGTFTATNTVSSGQTAAGAGQILSGYSGFVGGSEVKGSIGSKAAATYNTSTSDQTISSGQYLTGAQTIKAVTTANISAGNIKKDVNIKVGDANSSGRIANVTGTYTSSSTVSSGQTAAAAGQMVSGYSGWVNNTEVKGSLASKSSSDLSVSGATVTVPAGVYLSNASKAIGSGSASTPATTITCNPSISVSSAGLITASNSKTQSVTPSVSGGYISSASAGTISVSGSNTSQMTTKGATTYNVSSSDQTISAGTYLTGTQTFRAVTTTNISAANIKSGVTVQVGDAASSGRIVNVTGTYGTTIESKSGTPSTSFTSAHFVVKYASQLENSLIAFMMHTRNNHIVCGIFSVQNGTCNDNGIYAQPVMGIDATKGTPTDYYYFSSISADNLHFYTTDGAISSWQCRYVGSLSY